MRNNDYSDLLHRSTASLKSISVVVPWFNAHRYISVFRHGLAAQIDKDFELVLVDDGSMPPMPHDPGLWRDVARDLVIVRHTENGGGAAALNTGCALASAEKVIMLDADMAAPPNLVSDFRRTLSIGEDACAVGFRGTATLGEDNILPRSVLHDDWRAVVEPDDLFKVLTAQSVAMPPQSRRYRLLEETRNWRDFGSGRVIGYWDLPVMVVGHTVGADRVVYLDVGGTPEWCVGWGIRDTALGATLIQAGVKIIPQTSVVSTQAAHAPLAGSREQQVAELQANYRRYQGWLDQTPSPTPIRCRQIISRYHGVLHVDIGA